MKILIIGSTGSSQAERDRFDPFCRELGGELAQQPLTVILCSPYPDAADRGVAEGIAGPGIIAEGFRIELHYPRTVQNEDQWDALLATFNAEVPVARFRHESPDAADADAMKYAWLFCQLQAVSHADFVLVLGGKITGSSNLLIRIAESQGRQIIPLPGFGGAGEAFFNYSRYKLMDSWGAKNMSRLVGSDNAEQLVRMIVSHPADAQSGILTEGSLPPSFFISYSQERPADADFVEMILRRRNYQVFRDNNDFEPGENITSAISERIYKAKVFIALWCREYACSPWCFDELSIALQSHRKAGRELWIFNLDQTRMVHPDARGLLSYPVASREELSGKIADLLRVRD